MERDRRGHEVLARDECLRLLASGAIGRIGISRAALPTVLPVNYRLDGERILVITGSGSQLDLALRNAVVAFEVDDFDTADGSGWSVVVIGFARVVADSHELERVRALPTLRWAPDGEWRVIAISIGSISGRRVLAGTGRSVEWNPPFDLRAAARARTERHAAS
jgi:nitroimidazol reductase NimA-like FMN-containing flavoprotein (pyridoxamine 5'-phosphate oxidase superfamily)